MIIDLGIGPLEVIGHIAGGGGCFLHAEIGVFRNKLQRTKGIECVEPDAGYRVAISVIFAVITVKGHLMAKKRTDGNPADKRLIVIIVGLLLVFRPARFPRP